MACSGIVTNRRCGTPTIKVESFYPFLDCHQNRYSDGYSNQIRLNGVFYFHRQTEKTEFDDFDSLTSRQIYEVYKLELHAIRAESWLLKHILQVVLGGENITIDYTNEFGVSKIESGFYFKGEDIIREVVGKESWHIKVELYRKVCKVAFGCRV